MLGIAQNLSTRIVFKGLFCLRAVILVLLGALVLAGSAHAAGAVAEKAPEAPPAGPVAEEAPEAPPAGPVVEKAPEAPPAGPVVEKAPEAPPAGPVVEKAPEAPPAGPVVEKAPEAPPAGPVAEEAPEGKLAPPPAARQDAATPNNAAGVAAPEVPSTLTDSLTRASTVGGPGKTSATSAAGPASVGASTRMTVAQRARDLSCELSILGGRMTDNCTAGWSGTQRFLSASPTGFASAAASFAAATPGAPAGGDHDRSAVGSPPISPAPGPAPSGASGASAMGASALALSGFLTLARLLLLGAPRAMRRLRLSCQPWLTACFVLIPERPG
jgi:hypothetical protein